MLDTKPERTPATPTVLDANGVAARKIGNPIQAVQDAMWQSAYPDKVS
ncbi:MAG: hypothetical protein ACLP8X_19175 [Streptosporangiaceae bacterium]